MKTMKLDGIDYGKPGPWYSLRVCDFYERALYDSDGNFIGLELRRIVNGKIVPLEDGKQSIADFIP